MALSGAHALGRCHSDRSGFSGPWTHSPITFSNLYFQLLLDEKWCAHLPCMLASSLQRISLCLCDTRGPGICI